MLIVKTKVADTKNAVDIIESSKKAIVAWMKKYTIKDRLETVTARNRLKESLSLSETNLNEKKLIKLLVRFMTYLVLRFLQLIESCFL
jgi:ribosomal protein L4